MGRLSESKKNRTRQKNESIILKAAFELFSTRGYDATSVTDIIRVGGLSRGTFYSYFQSKEEIWERMVGLFAERIRKQLAKERRRAADIREFTYKTFTGCAKVLMHESYLDVLIRNQWMFRNTILSTSFLHSVYSDLENDITHFPEFAHLTADQVKMMSFSMVATAIELIFQTHINQYEFSPRELGQFFSSLFTGGNQKLKEQYTDARK